MSHPPAATVRPEPSRAPFSPTRVLFLINDLRVGGAERSLLNLVNHLRGISSAVVLIDPAVGSLVSELDASVKLFSLDRNPPAISAAELQWLSGEPLAHRRDRPLGQVLLELPPLLRSAYRLARLARRTEARVVSAYLNRSHTIALLAKLLFAPRLRVVINVHGMLSHHVASAFAPPARRFMRAFITRAFPRAEQIIAVSAAARDDLVQHFSVPLERISVVPNPLDLARIRALSAEHVDDVRLGDASPLIVGVGRLARLKGFDLLIRALARLPATLPARLLLIGQGEEGRTLAGLMTDLKVADRVTLLGARANPWKYMARATVVAVPSRTEAFPNVIGEALALGVPVVAARCSEGVAEYLEEGRCGVLVPPENVDALAAALELVLTDDALRRQLVQRGAERAEAFDLRRVVPRYERLITEVAK
jgi:glycosyltransferase involved in cell wall biosynthesis